MKLSELQTAGAYVPDKLYKRDVPFKRPVLLPKGEWADPEVPEESDEIVDDVLTVYIRKGSSADQIEFMASAKRERPFVAIFRSVCDEKGKPVFDSLEKAMSLKPWLAFPLFEAITEVAGDGPKGSRRKTNGGSKRASPTESPKAN